MRRRQTISLVVFALAAAVSRASWAQTAPADTDRAEMARALVARLKLDAATRFTPESRKRLRGRRAL